MTAISKAGKQLGHADERDLWGEALRLVDEIAPRAVLLENVPGLADPQFADARAEILDRLHSRGYYTWWQLIQASEHGVPQLRPRLVLAALRGPWPARSGGRYRTPAAADRG